MKNVLILLSVTTVFVFAINFSKLDTNTNTQDDVLTAMNADAGEKIAICHIPPGNPDNAHTIVISVNALEAHLRHGDVIGGCSTQEEGGPSDEPVGDQGEEKVNPGVDD